MYVRTYVSVCACVLAGIEMHMYHLLFSPFTLLPTIVAKLVSKTKCVKQLFPGQVISVQTGVHKLRRGVYNRALWQYNHRKINVQGRVTWIPTITKIN